MSRVFSKASDETVTYATGVGGNFYLWSLNKRLLEHVCGVIGKSTSSIYMNERHRCWVVRIKNKTHKQRFLSFGYLINV